MIRTLFCSLIAVPALFISVPIAAQNSPQTQPDGSTQPSEPPVQASPATPQQPSLPATQSPATSVPAPTPPEPKAARKGPVDSLKPGQFVWEKRAGYRNPLRMVAVLDIQRLYVFDGDELVGFSTISSGKPGKETPSGIFKILQKKVYHESNIYANAPMPFMQRLTWDGIAIHAGHLPGYPASHGCIRLPRRFAEALYGATQLDGEVIILESLSKPLARPKPVEPPVDAGAVPATQNPAPQQGTPNPPASAVPQVPSVPKTGAPNQPQSQSPAPTP